jgi:hypothetical protein
VSLRVGAVQLPGLQVKQNAKRATLEGRGQILANVASLSPSSVRALVPFFAVLVAFVVKLIAAFRITDRFAAGVTRYAIL